MKQTTRRLLAIPVVLFLAALAACGSPAQSIVTAPATTADAEAVPTASIAVGTTPTVAPTAAATQAAPTVAPTTAAETTKAPTAQSDVVSLAGQNDANSGADAANTAIDALEVHTTDSALEGFLGEDDEEDWYTFFGNDGGILEVAFRADKLSDGLSLYLLDPDRNALAEQYDIAPGKEVSLRYILNTVSGGAFYLRVTGQGAHVFRVSETLQNDGGGMGDAGDVLVDAIEFEPDRVIEGLLGDADEQDWYVAPLAHGAIIDVAFTPAKDADELSLYLYDPNQEEIWSTYHVVGGITKSTRYLLNAAGGGAYYLQVVGGSGSYTVDFKAGQQNDAGLGGDAPQDDDALGVLPNEALNGELGDADEEDWYYFDPAEGMTISFAPAKGSKNLSLYLFDGNRDGVWDAYHVIAEKQVSFTLEELTDGHYLICITDGVGAYTFEIRE